MPGAFHTVYLPVLPSAVRALSFPAQYPGSLRTLILDCTDWLADASTTIETAAVLQDPSLAPSGVLYDTQTVSLQVTGGVSGTIVVLGYTLTLANGDVELVTVALPIIAEFPALSLGAVPVGNIAALLTRDGSVILTRDGSILTYRMPA